MEAWQLDDADARFTASQQRCRFSVPTVTLQHPHDRAGVTVEAT